MRKEQVLEKHLEFLYRKKVKDHVKAQPQKYLRKHVCKHFKKHVC